MLLPFFSIEAKTRLYFFFVHKKSVFFQILPNISRLKVQEQIVYFCIFRAIPHIQKLYSLNVATRIFFKQNIANPPPVPPKSHGLFYLVVVLDCMLPACR